eukprot:GFUD01064916.1.p1 GENE.GFUD01064916.1~~GFUD01064916.1.p1  ORF type:complete len:179 (-),score=45.95 GFUD01064916.1:205-741(-)
MDLSRTVLSILLIAQLTKSESCTDRQVPCATAPLPSEYYDEYLNLMQSAGYQLDETPQLEAVHCRPEKDTFQGNGFVNAYGKVNEKMSRIIAYAAGQTLRVHKHDVYELFDITYGTAILTTWDDGLTARPHTREIGPGYKMEVKEGVEHKLVAGENGLVFHELVDADTFGKRSTWFIE